MQTSCRIRAFKKTGGDLRFEKWTVKGLIPSFFTAAFAFVFAFALAQIASANLVSDGTFNQITYSGTSPLSNAYVTSTGTYGQFGNDAVAGNQATGSTLAVSGWTTTGYNFVYAPNTADYGTQAAGGTNSTVYEAPGQYNVSQPIRTGGSTRHPTYTNYDYGNTFLWGTNNGGTGTMAGGGTGTIDAAPGGGNFIAMDGVYEVDRVSQSIAGLTVGQTYVLTFNWAAAQQQGFTGATTEWLQVNLGGSFTEVGGTGGYFTGGQTYTTGTISLPSEAFSGWYQDTLYFTATSTTETLSFLAGGTPAGEPPFSLLANVDMEVIPEFSNWMVFAGFGVICILFEVMRRRRQSKRGADSSLALT